MRFPARSLALTLLQLDNGLCSPLLSNQASEPRNRPARNVYQAVSVIVSNLQLEKATPFCSSFLHLSPQTVTADGTSTSVETTTSLVGTTTGLTVTSFPNHTSSASVTQTIVNTQPSTTSATLTVTETQRQTETERATGGLATTSTVFKPGDPPAAAKEKRDNDLEERKATILLTPTYARQYPAAQLSIACSCLNISVPTTTVTSQTVITSISTIQLTAIHASNTTFTNSSSLMLNTVTIPQTSIIQVLETITVATITTTITETTTTTKTPQPTIYTTVYPCAAPLPSPGPAYGDYADSNPLGLQNGLFYLDTPEGNNATSCCNICFFGVANCIQAYWYSYEGCVVSQATNLDSASGEGVSTSCPAGTFDGLSYGPDLKPAFRSTGNIVGPCGRSYTNF